MLVPVAQWKALCRKVFSSTGMPSEDVHTLVDAAVFGDMRGVASHGSVRLSRYYDRLQAGLINKHPQLRIEVDLPGLLHLDGDNGLGQVVAAKAMDLAIERAARNGSCMVSIRNTNHMGVLSYYAVKAAEQGMVATIMCNTSPFVAVFGGAEPIIGTNPVCWAVPGPDFPVVMDMAISPARGKIRNAAAKGEPIPAGWAVNKEGLPTTIAQEAMDGTLLPVGGVKGSGIGLIVEMLTGIVSGGRYGQNLTNPLEDFENIPDLSNFISVMDINKIMPREEFLRRMLDYIKFVKSSRKAPGVMEIFLPGELAAKRYDEALSNGVLIDDNTFACINELAAGL